MGELSQQGITAEIYKAIIAVVDERIKEIRVTREDFDALKGVIRNLAEAQKRTEARVEELAEAQRASEKRLTRLEKTVAELAEAQKRTEARVEELAEAQKRTEETLQGVIKEQKNLKKQIGGLTNTIGYNLEDRAISSLPLSLEKDHGIRVDIMDRRFIEYPEGKEDEINIYGEGSLDGERIYIIGESKSQLGKKDVDKFKKRVERIRGYLGGKIVPILVTYQVRPKVERYAVKAIEGLLIYKSYQLKV